MPTTMKPHPGTNRHFSGTEMALTLKICVFANEKAPKHCPVTAEVASSNLVTPAIHLALIIKGGMNVCPAKFHQLSVYRFCPLLPSFGVFSGTMVPKVPNSF